MSEQIVEVTININGESRNAAVPSRLLLSDFIRHEVGLTGTHVGCEHGVCGCCTVMIDGQSARSCLAFAVQCDGANITTVESLAGPDDALNVLQQAFHECHALQCGFCTPGFLMSISEYLDRERRADITEAEVREAISGNLCRCTGYTNIVDAALLAATRLFGEGN
jgi:carbon-monoxide dehydrogenase small subunit